MEYISKNYIKNLLKKRNPDSHKGDYGKILIIAGSKGMAGAAVLAAKGALRSGAGLVRISIDEELFPIVQTLVPCATCVGRDFTESFMNENSAVVIGPGIGKSRKAEISVAKVLETCYKPVVADADALNIIGANDVDLRKATPSMIITPHNGEAARLINVTVNEVNNNRLKTVSYLAESTETVAVLKGHNTLIGVKEKNESQTIKVYENTTGNPGMATGGSGDVLSGIIGSFLGQGLSPKDAALAGVYIHGCAGDLASKNYGEYGVTAEDIGEYVAYAIKEVRNE